MMLKSSRTIEALDHAVSMHAWNPRIRKPKLEHQMHFKTRVGPLIRLLERAATTVGLQRFANARLSVSEDGLAITTCNPSFDAIYRITEPDNASIVVDKAGTVGVVPSMMMCLLNEQPHEEPVEVKKNGDLLILTAHCFSGEVSCINEDELPKLRGTRMLDNPKLITRGQLALIARLLYAVSTDETRYVLGGVYFDNDGHIVTTDGHRMAVKRDFGADNLSKVFGKPVIVSGAGIRALTEMDCDVHVSIKTTGNNLSESSIIQATNGETELLIAVIEGRYPDWKSVMNLLSSHSRRIRFGYVPI